jgi:hypothetical protein
MRKLMTAALLLAAMLGTPTMASARDWGWDDRGRHEWRDEDRYDRRDYRRDRRHWRDDRDHRRWSDRRHWRRDRWDDRRWRRYAYRGDVVCRTYWRYDYPERVCWRR